jgi:hypothetical protein
MSLRAMQDSLKKFNIHVDGSPIATVTYGQKRCYRRESFEEAWQTYCKAPADVARAPSPSLNCRTVGNACGSGTSDDLRGVGGDAHPTPRKHEETSVNSSLPTVLHLEEEEMGGDQSAGLTPASSAATPGCSSSRCTSATARPACTTTEMQESPAPKSCGRAGMMLSSCGVATKWNDVLPFIFLDEIEAVAAIAAAASTASRLRSAAKQRRLWERRGKAAPTKAALDGVEAALQSKEGHPGPILRDERSIAWTDRFRP